MIMLRSLCAFLYDYIYIYIYLLGKLESNKLYKLEQEKKKQREERIREEGILYMLPYAWLSLCQSYVLYA